jgi:IS5 family transposase
MEALEKYELARKEAVEADARVREAEAEKERQREASERAETARRAEQERERAALEARSAAEASRPRTRLSIKFQTRGAKRPTEIDAFADEKFEDIFRRYAAQVKQPVGSLRFRFDGDAVGPGETPANLDMEDGDIVDVAARP